MITMIVPLILWVIILVLVFPVYLLAIIIFGLYRLFVNFIVWKCKPDLVAHFTSRDLMFTCDDFEGKVRKSVINVTVLEGSLSLAALRETLNKRLLEKSFFFKLHCRPRLFLGYWFWEKTEMHIESHTFEHSETKSDDELKTFLPKWLAEPYAPKSPMWSVMLLRLTGNRTAIVFKMHHMIGDGVSFMKLLEYFCDGEWSSLKIRDVKPFTWLHWIYAWYNFWWNVLKAYRLARIRKGFRPNIYCGEGFSSWTELPLEKLRVVRRHTKCMFQSAMGGIMSNAIHRMLESYGKTEIPKTIRLVIPIPWPNRTQLTLTNHVGFLHAELPIGGGVEAIRGFDSNVRASFKLGMHGGMWEFFRGMYIVPMPLLNAYTTWGETNIPPVILSSIPGTMSVVKVAGLKVLQSYPVLSLGCSMGVNATITTYEEKAHFAMRVSREVLPSQESLDLLINKYIHEELESMYQLALASGSENQKKDVNTNHIKLQITEK